MLGCFTRISRLAIPDVQNVFFHFDDGRKSILFEGLIDQHFDFAPEGKCTQGC